MNTAEMTIRFTLNSDFAKISACELVKARRQRVELLLRWRCLILSAPVDAGLSSNAGEPVGENKHGRCQSLSLHRSQISAAKDDSTANYRPFITRFLKCYPCKRGNEKSIGQVKCQFS